MNDKQLEEVKKRLLEINKMICEIFPEEAIKVEKVEEISEDES